MKELLFKSETSVRSKKRDFSIQETVMKNGMIATTEKRCIYFLMGKYPVNNSCSPNSMSNGDLVNIPYKKRHYFVLKTHDQRQGKDKILCKVAGTLYAINGSEIYCIAFVHSLKMTFSKPLECGGA